VRECLFCFAHQGNSPLLYTAFYDKWRAFVALIPGSDINAAGVSAVSRKPDALSIGVRDGLVFQEGRGGGDAWKQVEGSA
jgi:hypothetical protein